MNKIKNFIKDKYLYFLSFAIITFIYVLVLMLRNISPFGDRALFVGDAYSQFYPFMVKYKDAILNNELVMNWNAGLGSPFFRIFLVYLSSPINLVILLFDKSHMDIAYHLILYIKLILSGFSIIYYLKYKFNSNKAIILIPAILYAFSGYFLGYYMYIQWFDALYVLPLLTMGIEKLVDKHKIGLLVGSLVYMLICSIYMGYMICIYTVIYFIVYNIFYVKGKNIKDKINNMSRNFLIILGSSVLALLIITPFLYLYYYTSSTLGNIGGGFPTKRLFDYTYLDFYNNSLLGGKSLLFNMEHSAPLVYAGILSVLMFIPFILNKIIKMRDKIFLISMLAIFFMFFRIPILDFVMNVFHVPNGVPYRYSYMYSFIMIIVLTHQLLNNNIKINLKNILCLTIPTILMVLLVILNRTSISYDNYLIIIVVALIILYYLISLFIKKKTILLLILVCFECVVVMHRGLKQSIVFETGIVEMSDKIDNNSLVQLDYYHSEENSFKNEAYINDYNSLISFDSSEYEELGNLLRLFGTPSGGTIINYYPNTYIFHSIFNIKYFYGFDFSNNKDYTLIDDKLYQYNYSLGKIYGVNDYIDVTDFDQDLFYNQNAIMEAFTNVNDILYPVKIEGKKTYEDDLVVVYDYEFDDDIYYTYNGYDIFYIVNGKKMYASGIPFEKYLELYDFDDNNMIVNKIKHINTANKKLTVAFYKEQYSSNPSLEFYRVDMNKFKKAYEYLSSRQLTIDSIDTYGLKGHINAQEDMNMFSVIPYDDGWHVYIDGEEVEKVKALDCMVGFKIPKGEHKIELRYKIPRLIETVLISLATILGIIVYNIIKKVRKRGGCKSI